MGKIIAITGVNGYVASTLLPLLESDVGVERIIGIDITPWKGGFKKITFVREDIRSTRMADILKEVDIVYHLACAEDDLHDRHLVHDVNVHGSQNVFSACAHCAVKKIICVSSTSVYTLQENPSHQYAENDPISADSSNNSSTSTAVSVETVIHEFMNQHPNIVFTVLRSATVIGPNIDNMLERSLSSKLIALPDGPDRHIQFIHEDDLGKALYLAYRMDIPGIFNVAADDTVHLTWCFRAAGVNVMEIPAFLAERIADIGFRLRVYPLSKDTLHLLALPMHVRSEKLKNTTGWSPAYSSRDALMTYVNKMRTRKAQDSFIQAVLSWIIKSGKRLKPFLPVLETFRLGKIPGLRRLIPWLNPDKNCITYLPVNENIHVESDILPSHIVHDLIESSSIHVIMDKCGCRMLRNCTRYTHDIGCLFMGETALKLPHGVCHKVSKQEAHAHADRAISLGLLPMIGKVRIDNFIYMTPDRSTLLSLCFCCDCCCILTSYKHVPGNYLDGIIQPIEGLRVEVSDACIGCGTCIETCAFNAITIRDGRAVHSSMCRGCGRCATFCPSHAVTISISNEQYADEVKTRIRSYVEF